MQPGLKMIYYLTWRTITLYLVHSRKDNGLVHGNIQVIDFLIYPQAHLLKHLRLNDFETTNKIYSILTSKKIP
jgi:hypothetical protein